VSADASGQRDFGELAADLNEHGLHQHIELQDGRPSTAATRTCEQRSTVATVRERVADVSLLVAPAA